MKIKIMIVDDSIVVRAMIKQVIEKNKEIFEIVASAKNGEDALFQLKREDIDVIIMDVEMPKMNGIETLREIMQHNPKPVVMFSSLTGQDTRETIEALQIGAIDVMKKPMKHAEFLALQDEMYKKIITAYRAKEKIRKTINRTKNEEKTYMFDAIKREKQKKEIKNIILIGSSTGGPKALNEILKDIPLEINATFLIVQHMPEGNYTKMLAEHLNGRSKLKIKEAENGDEVKNGHVYIGKPGYHMNIIEENGRLKVSFSEKEKQNGHKPSVDELIRSAKYIKGKRIISIILTGMGADGSLGAKELKQNNEKAIFIAESEETAIVYGMPKQLKKQIPETKSVPLYEITTEIIKKINETNV